MSCFVLHVPCIVIGAGRWARGPSFGVCSLAVSQQVVTVKGRGGGGGTGTVALAHNDSTSLGVCFRAVQCDDNNSNWTVSKYQDIFSTADCGQRANMCTDRGYMKLATRPRCWDYGMH